MSRYGVDHRIARPSGICAATGERIEPGSPCVATLREGGDDGGLERADYSLAAWESGARPEGLVCYWRTTVPHSDSERKVFVDDDVLMDVFERLGGDDRRQRVAYRFILGLILLRKKKVKYVGRKGQGESERWLFVPTGSAEAEPIEVINPHLSDEDVRELTDQLGEVLRGEF